MSVKRLIVSIVLVVIGLIMATYSFISNKYNEMHTASIITKYDETVKSLDQSFKDSLIHEAKDYNASLVSAEAEITDPFKPGKKHKELIESYSKLLSIDDSGFLCSVEIPSINVREAVYHGCSDEVLKIGAGHLQGTSIPVGGKSTHAVIAAHSGLSTARLFSDLEKVQLGDVFYINFLSDSLVYKVDQINIVEPDDTSKLYIEKDKDYCTLVTCTPYGINSHRLLVRGVRSKKENIEMPVKVKRDSVWLKEYKQALVIGLVMVTVMLIINIIRKLKKKAEEQNETKK